MVFVSNLSSISLIFFDLIQSPRPARAPPAGGAGRARRTAPPGRAARSARAIPPALPGGSERAARRPGSLEPRGGLARAAACPAGAVAPPPSCRPGVTAVPEAPERARRPPFRVSGSCRRGPAVTSVVVGNYRVSGGGNGRRGSVSLGTRWPAVGRAGCDWPALTGRGSASGPRPGAPSAPCRPRGEGFGHSEPKKTEIKKASNPSNSSVAQA